MGPIETLVIGIFTMLFLLIGIFWVGSDERPSKYSARRSMRVTTKRPASRSSLDP